MSGETKEPWEPESEDDGSDTPMLLTGPLSRFLRWNRAMLERRSRFWRDLFNLPEPDDGWPPPPFLGLRPERQGPPPPPAS